MNNMVRRNKTVCALLLIALGVVLIAIIIAGSLNDLFTLTSNNTELLDPYVSVPTFSCESGFYNEPFYLELSAPPNAKIYYTLDCSDPDVNSIEYHSPILIESVSDKANTHSMRTDVSVGFYSDLIEGNDTVISAPKYTAPDYPVKKCMVVRAVVVDDQGNYSDIKTNSYFVEEDLSFFDDCNIISVVTDPDNLFDSEKGIYVTGDVFSDYILKKQPAELWELWEANYRQKGQKWERPVDFACFNSSGELLLSSNGGIRTQGGISRGTLPRSLSLYLNTENADGNLMNDQLFSSGFYPTKMTLFAGGNERIALFKDSMISDRTQALNFAKMTYVPYVLFLDGEYWGFYWLTNSYNERYISYNYSVEEDNVIMVKNGALECGNDIDILFYDNMKNFITTNDMAIADNYKYACELIDMDSFLDYYACLAYIARNGDWPSSNYALWRTRTVGDGYSDGKWRWMLFDVNSSSMTESLITHDTLTCIINSDDIFRSLWENSEFRRLFEEKILRIADECFNAQEISEYLDQYAEEMRPTLSNSWARFYGSKNTKETSFYSIIEEHKTFFNKRRDVVVSWFDESTTNQ